MSGNSLRRDKVIDVRVLASGSSGNCYFVNGDTPLLIEAGITYKTIQQKLNWKISELAGVLISHEHL